MFMIKKRKVIITFSYYGIGGAQRRAINLANEFVNNGYQVEILAVLGKDGSIKHGENHFNLDERIDLVLIPDYYELNKTTSVVKRITEKNKKKIKWLKRMQFVLKPIKVVTNRINDIIRGVRSSNDLRAYLIENQGAVIINFGFNIFEKVYWAAKGLNFKLVYAETNASDKFINDKNFNATCRLLKKANSWIFQTEEQRRFLGYENNPNAKVIHNPIKNDLSDVYIGDKRKVIVNFCRLSPQKNLMLLIKAFESFSEQNPEYVLKIYADTVSNSELHLREELLLYIDEHNLQEKIFILPPRADIHDVIKDCTMFVSSSDYEGISNSMIEAMAMGLPCVCTDCRGGGAREMITDGENGLLVPVGDVEALSQAMHRMINEEGLAEKCGKNAALVRATLSIEKIAEQWIDVIEKVNGKR